MPTFLQEEDYDIKLCVASIPGLAATWGDHESSQAI